MSQPAQNIVNGSSKKKKKGGKINEIEDEKKSKISELECPVCLEAFHPDNEERLPRLLECAHSFCASCLLKLKKNGLFSSSPGPSKRLRRPYRLSRRPPNNSV